MVKVELWLVVYRYPDRSEVVGYFSNYDAAVVCWKKHLSMAHDFYDECASIDLVQMVESDALN